jgi:hypothetical protein
MKSLIFCNLYDYNYNSNLIFISSEIIIGGQEIMHNNRKRIVVNLVGGLGNQLFTYFAGQRISQELNVIIEFHLEPVIKPSYQSNSTINSFQLSIPKYSSFTKTLWSNFRRYIPDKFISFFYKALTKSSFRGEQLSIKIINTYREQNFEPVSEILKIKQALDSVDKLFLSGFFQDFYYFDTFVGERNLLLKSPSIWFNDTEKKLKKMNAPIMVHLRLGDYVKPGNTMGVLSSEYWHSAIGIALQMSPNSEVWIFSDEFQLARKMLSSAHKNNFKFIESSANKDPAEVLKILSMGSVLVVSNSTLSLWAGRVATPGTRVLVPDPLFVSKTKRVGSLPSDWIKVKSKFFDESEILNFNILRH